MNLKSFAYVSSILASLTVLIFSLGLIGWGVTQPQGVDRYGRPEMNAAVGAGLLLALGSGGALFVTCYSIIDNTKTK